MAVPSVVSPADSTLTVKYWEDRWKNGQIGFHQEDGHPLLKKNLLPILEKTYGSSVPKSLKVFVPLCGKSKDLIFFYNLGFTVVGIEYAAQAVHELFEESSMEKVEEDVNGAHFVKSTDGRLIIAVGDFFSFTPGQPNSRKLPYEGYDIIWDRGSLEAVNANNRDRYCQFIVDIMNPNICNYFLTGEDYDKAEYGGPPLALPEEDVKTLYGTFCSIEIIDSSDTLAVGSRLRTKFMNAGITKMIEYLYLMKPIPKMQPNPPN